MGMVLHEEKQVRMNNQLIYVVDDEADYLNLVHYVFTQFLPQYVVSLFPSGEALLGNLQSTLERPALILLDFHMPIMSGQQTLVRLKQELAWKPIPVVVVTSATSDREIQSCYEAGANSCLAKPTNMESMQNLFKRVCSYWVDTNGMATAELV